MVIFQMITNTQTGKKFLFEKVVTFPYYINYLLGFVVVIPFMVLYAMFGFSFLGLWGLVLTFLISGFLVMSIIKYRSKSINIYFDEQNMYVVNGKNPTIQYPKNEIAGFYSYDYDQVEKSFISLLFVFKNGSRLELTDINVSEKIDQKKAEMLKQFLRTAQRELTFTKHHKNRSRSLQKLGAVWYATSTDQ